MEQNDDDINNKLKSNFNISGETYDEQLLKRSKNVYFDVEAWYEIIRSETFYTEFIPVSPAIAQAFVNFYQTRYMSRKSLNFIDIKLIQSIQNQLNLKINNDTFIRLSARSPKDGKPLDSQKIRQYYTEKFNELQTKYPDEYLTIKGKANIQITAYYYAQFHSMKVTDEIQALNLILTSERVYYDLLEILDCEQVQDPNMKVYDWNNHIIIRRWNNFLDPSMEFRCFVYQSNLTAISQYNFFCKYYHLQNNEIIQQIKLTIKKYWQEKIHPLLNQYPEKYSNYVIDIGLINQYDCIVIEMNPFELTTNPSLFNWTTDNDQLKGQGNDLEIRVRSDYYPHIEDYIEYILEVNQCNEENKALSDHPGSKPYYTFLDQMETQLSS
ncbi:unnamed protein product [Adineta steineri]|uniref:Cell division cycle protein 123 homolog n=1 Tax=Adineta steineri TaxID=433720 RepID=A0A813RPZ7_9BILA|nr:unnamed protein product [Adineta steineri]CAF3977777.1 unnamed protein product [Adineta steineri]